MFSSNKRTSSYKSWYNFERSERNYFIPKFCDPQILLNYTTVTIFRMLVLPSKGSNKVGLETDVRLCLSVVNRLILSDTFMHRQ